jgi:Protein of unknown function (DUF1488)
MEGQMALMRDEPIGHDPERLAFKFTMLNEGKVVPCQISDAAMDELGGTTGTGAEARHAQFLSLREAIEGIASDLFAQAPPIDGYVVRIFTKHVKRQEMTADSESAKEASPPPPSEPEQPQAAIDLSATTAAPDENQSIQQN